MPTIIATDPAPGASARDAILSSWLKTDPDELLRHVPNELKGYPHWVVWALEMRTDRRGEATPTKVPYTPGSWTRAKSNDHATGRSFQEALAAFTSSLRYQGIGFILSADDPFVAIDLDHCVVGGRPEPWAQEILDRFEIRDPRQDDDAYAELSPSGTGLRVITKASLPSGSGNRRGDVEMYDRNRFVTVTGRKIA